MNKKIIPIIFVMILVLGGLAYASGPGSTTAAGTPTSSPLADSSSDLPDTGITYTTTTDSIIVIPGEAEDISQAQIDISEAITFVEEERELDIQYALEERRQEWLEEKEKELGANFASPEEIADLNSDYLSFDLQAELDANLASFEKALNEETDLQQRDAARTEMQTIEDSGIIAGLRYSEDPLIAAIAEEEFKRRQDAVERDAAQAKVVQAGHDARVAEAEAEFDADSAKAAITFAPALSSMFDSFSITQTVDLKKLGDLTLLNGQTITLEGGGTATVSHVTSNGVTTTSLTSGNSQILVTSSGTGTSTVTTTTVREGNQAVSTRKLADGSTVSTSGTTVQHSSTSISFGNNEVTRIVKSGGNTFEFDGEQWENYGGSDSTTASDLQFMAWAAEQLDGDGSITVTGAIVDGGNSILRKGDSFIHYDDGEFKGAINTGSSSEEISYGPLPGDTVLVPQGGSLELVTGDPGSNDFALNVINSDGRVSSRTGEIDGASFTFWVSGSSSTLTVGDTDLEFSAQARTIEAIDSSGNEVNRPVPGGHYVIDEDPEHIIAANGDILKWDGIDWVVDKNPPADLENAAKVVDKVGNGDDLKSEMDTATAENQAELKAKGIVLKDSDGVIIKPPVDKDGRTSGPLMSNVKLDSFSDAAQKEMTAIFEGIDSWDTREQKAAAEKLGKFIATSTNLADVAKAQEIFDGWEDNEDPETRAFAMNAYTANLNARPLLPINIKHEVPPKLFNAKDDDPNKAAKDAKDAETQKKIVEIEKKNKEIDKQIAENKDKNIIIAQQRSKLVTAMANSLSGESDFNLRHNYARNLAQVSSPKELKGALTTVALNSESSDDGRANFEALVRAGFDAEKLPMSEGGVVTRENFEAAMLAAGYNADNEDDVASIDEAFDAYVGDSTTTLGTTLGQWANAFGQRWADAFTTLPKSCGGTGGEAGATGEGFSAGSTGTCIVDMMAQILGQVFAGYENYKGIGTYSSLFMDDEDLAERREEVAQQFCDSIILASQSCLVGKICETYPDDSPDNGVLVMSTPGGGLNTVAHIEAKKIEIEFVNNSQQQKEYIYKITYLINNPHSEPMMFNLNFNHNSGIVPYWVGADQIIQESSSDSRLGSGALIFKSKKDYSRVCLTFNPRIESHAGDYVGNVCNIVVFDATERVPLGYAAGRPPPTSSNAASTVNTDL